MGWRFRRSVKLFPGVRLNVTKNGVGLGFGGNGLRYSIHSTGRRTTSFGIPGTGLYWTESRIGAGTRERATPAATRQASGSMASAGSASPDYEGDSASVDASATPPRPDLILRSLADVGAAVVVLPAGEPVGTGLSRLDSILDGSRDDEGEIESSLADLEGLLADAESTLWAWHPQIQEHISVGLQPMPGFEVVVPLDRQSLLLLCACHLLAASRLSDAERFLAAVPDSDEKMLVAAAARMHANDPAGALALGQPEVDSLSAWLTDLIRAQALLECHRYDEAQNVLSEHGAAARNLQHEPGDEAREIAATIRARVLLAKGNATDACRVLADVLAVDPFDRDAMALLKRAHEMLYAVSGTTSVAICDPEIDASKLRIVLASLERELHAAQDILLDIVEELAELAGEQDRCLGARRLRLAALKAQLAALIAVMSGSQEDADLADRCEDDLRREESEQEQHADRGHANDRADQEINEQSAHQPELEQAEAEAKKLRRHLAKRWHPDLGTDPEDVARRTEMLQRINRMYDERDVEGLRRLWEQGALAAAGEDNGSVAALAEQIQRTRKALADTREEISALLSSPLESLRIEREEGLREGRDLFAELADSLDKELDEVESSLRSLQDESAFRRGTSNGHGVEGAA